MRRLDTVTIALGCLGIFGGLSARAAELQQPVPFPSVALSPGPSFGSSIPIGATACNNLGPAPGPVVPLQLVVRNADRPDVGPYTVRLPGYGTNVAPNSPQFYRPFLIHANQGDSLRFDVVNQLDTGSLNENDTNLHTHGLVVMPRPCVPLGDYIFVNDPTNTTTSYRIDIPQTLPGYMFGSQATPRTYPSGLYWFHGHIHEYSDDQVAGGQSGVLYVGDLLSDLRNAPGLDAGTASTLANTDVLYLGLRDIQLAVPVGATPDKAGPGTRGQWLSHADYNPAACLSNANPPIPIPGTFSGFGYCGHHLSFAGGRIDPFHDTVWMFTINGQYNPTVTMKPGRNQIWRINNLSANATYVLELDDNATGKAVPVTAFAYDGLASGSNTVGSSGLKVGAPETQVLLTPGNRIELFVPNIGGPNGKQLTLRTVGLTTGAEGAPWPRIDLAHVTMPAGPSTLPALNVTLPNAAPSLVAPAVVASSTTPPANCIVLPPGQRTHRLITFEDGPAAGEYVIGSQVVDQFERPVGAKTTIPPQQFPMMAMDSPNVIPHVCARIGEQEVWEILNASGEMHNFHIHQNKFRLTRPTDNGAPFALTLLGMSAYQDPSGLISPFIPELHDGTPTQPVDIWRDVLALPPYGGRVFVTIPFYSPVQVGDFVYHCHILSHESGGMMAVVQVYQP